MLRVTPTALLRLAPTRRTTRALAFVVAWVTALGTLLAGMGQLLVQHGRPAPFWTLVVTPSSAVFILAFFFELAIMFALVLKCVLAHDSKQRRVAGGGALLCAYIALSQGLAAAGIRYLSTTCGSVDHVTKSVMWFAIVAEAADGSLAWLGRNLAFYVPIAVALSYTDPDFHTVGTPYPAPGASATSLALLAVYTTFGALFRAGAIHTAEVANARDARERWWYRALAVAVVALWLSIFAYSDLAATQGAPAGRLYIQMVYNGLVYSFTPLVLTNFLILGHAKDADQRQQLLKAEAAYAAVEGAMKGRRQYLGYIFHEARYVKHVHAGVRSIPYPTVCRLPVIVHAWLRARVWSHSCCDRSLCGTRGHARG